jgi:hypothetical protein
MDRLLAQGGFLQARRTAKTTVAEPTHFDIADFDSENAASSACVAPHPHAHTRTLTRTCTGTLVDTRTPAHMSTAHRSMHTQTHWRIQYSTHTRARIPSNFACCACLVCRVSAPFTRQTQNPRRTQYLRQTKDTEHTGTPSGPGRPSRFAVEKS